METNNPTSWCKCIDRAKGTPHCRYCCPFAHTDDWHASQVRNRARLLIPTPAMSTRTGNRQRRRTSGTDKSPWANAVLGPEPMPVSVTAAAPEEVQ